MSERDRDVIISPLSKENSSYWITVTERARDERRQENPWKASNSF